MDKYCLTRKYDKLLTRLKSTLNVDLHCFVILRNFLLGLRQSVERNVLYLKKNMHFLVSSYHRLIWIVYQFGEVRIKTQEIHSTTTHCIVYKWRNFCSIRGQEQNRYYESRRRRRAAKAREFRLLMEAYGQNSNKSLRFFGTSKHLVPFALYSHPDYCFNFCCGIRVTAASQ